VRPHTDALPSPLDLAYITQVHLLGLCDTLRDPDVISRLAADDALCRSLRTRLATMHDDVDAAISDTRKALGRGD